MKRVFMFALIVLSFSNCEKIDEYTQFELDFKETVVVPSSTSINLPFNLFTPKIETNSESEFEINDTRKDLVESIKLTKLRLKLVSPQNEDFSFLESISIFIEADGLAEKKVARKDNISSGTGNELTLDLTDIDLQEYIKKDKFNLRVNTITDELLTSDHQIDIFSIFFVDAKILGQ